MSVEAQGARGEGHAAGGDEAVLGIHQNEEERDTAHFAVLAVGRDRSGIVAWIAGAVHELSGTIETSQMARLGDQFSMMLVVAAKGVSRNELLMGLDATGSEYGEYKVLVTDITEYDSRASADASHLLTVHCIERSGVISAIASALSDRDVNITHLHSLVELAEPTKQKWCVTRAYVTLPHDLGEEALKEAVEGALSEYGGSVKLEQLTDPPRWG